MLRQQDGDSSIGDVTKESYSAYYYDDVTKAGDAAGAADTDSGRGSGQLTQAITWSTDRAPPTTATGLIVADHPSHRKGMC